MIKLVGAACVFLGCGTIWGGQRTAKCRELAILRDLVRMLEQMEDEIQMLRTPMPRLLEKLAQGRTAPVALCLGGIRAALEQEEPLNRSWQSGVRALPIPRETQSALEELGERLDGSEEQLCNGISLVRKELGRVLTEQRCSQRETERRSAALYFSAAALLVIILI